MTRAESVLVTGVFTAGCALNATAYASLEPVAAALLFIGPLGLLVGWASRWRADEQRAFLLLFGIGWTMAGLAAWYVNALDDPFQLTSDPARLYRLALLSRHLSFRTLLTLTDTPGAIWLWQKVYAGFGGLGFEAERYLGILVNVSCVALAGVLAVTMTRMVYGEDAGRIKRVTVAFGSCALFWLFASMHLRDALVLLAATLMAVIWVWYLGRPGLRRAAWLFVASLAGIPIFFLLRAEFLVVPLAMFLAGVVAQAGFGHLRPIPKLLSYAVVLLCLAAAVVEFLRVGTSIVSRGSAVYLLQAQRTEGAASLGMQLIVRQPLPVRLLLGSIYLYTVPIPAWAGIGDGSIYHLFKSLNTLFFDALMPLTAVAVLRLWRDRSARTAPVMFLVMVVSGFTAAVAATSLETRHLGAFLVPLLVVAMLPDLSIPAQWRAYKFMVVKYCVVVAAVYLAWGALQLR